MNKCILIKGLLGLEIDDNYSYIMQKFNIKKDPLNYAGMNIGEE